MCQTDPDVAGVTSPCADSVGDFKVENDGTTTIEYHELTDKSDYKRYFARFAMHLWRHDTHAQKTKLLTNIKTYIIFSHDNSNQPVRLLYCSFNILALSPVIPQNHFWRFSGRYSHVISLSLTKPIRDIIGSISALFFVRSRYDTVMIPGRYGRRVGYWKIYWKLGRRKWILVLGGVVKPIQCGNAILKWHLILHCH